ncbi:hypothetical protein [Streptomyces sp. NPDC055681]
MDDETLGAAVTELGFIGAASGDLEPTAEGLQLIPRERHELLSFEDAGVALRAVSA